MPPRDPLCILARTDGGGELQSRLELQVLWRAHRRLHDSRQALERQRDRTRRRCRCNWADLCAYRCRTLKFSALPVSSVFEIIVV